ncbi:MAG: hypothetical protein ACTHN8_11810 [Angustibacter sp.]
MTTTTSHQSRHLDPAHPSDVYPRPSRMRRAALAAAAFVACALPVVFTVNVTRMLLTGVDADHRFHQATGQGLVLFALWLGPLLGLVRAGWQGRRPGSALGWQHLLFVAIGLVCSAIAPGGGAPFLTGVIAVTGALLWVALPRRPRLKVAVQVHPVLAPVALVGAAALTPYAVSQLAAQNDVTAGYHAVNPHLFDMGWMALCLIGWALTAALSPVLRGLMTWFAACVGVVGAAGLVFGEPAGWSVLVLGLGVVATAAATLTPRVERTRTAVRA